MYNRVIPEMRTVIPEDIITDTWIKIWEPINTQIRREIGTPIRMDVSRRK